MFVHRREHGRTQPTCDDAAQLVSTDLLQCDVGAPAGRMVGEVGVKDSSAFLSPSEAIRRFSNWCVQTLMAMSIVALSSVVALSGMALSIVVLSGVVVLSIVALGSVALSWLWLGGGAVAGLLQRPSPVSCPVHLASASLSSASVLPEPTHGCWKLTHGCWKLTHGCWELTHIGWQLHSLGLAGSTINSNAIDALVQCERVPGQVDLTSCIELTDTSIRKLLQ